MINVKLFMLGMLTMGFLVASLFFLKFWRRSHDRLFAAFALAFLVFASERSASALWIPLSSAPQEMFLLRLAGFLLILAAIIDKNLKATKKRGRETIAYHDRKPGGRPGRKR